MPLSVGEKLGPYEILSPIGAGGMGDVYKARDTRLDRIVAIKVSKTEFSERFEREAQAIAALNHQARRSPCNSCEGAPPASVSDRPAAMLNDSSMKTGAIAMKKAGPEKRSS